MGQVFRAIDTRLDRAVAIKVLSPNRWTDVEFRSRFQREARAISSLSHPNLCALYDVGEIDGAPFLVMELLEGETLRERLGHDTLAPRTAVAWAAQIANGLAAAHEKGLVHRDLKPENVFVTRERLLKILDFGLAKAATPAEGVNTEPGVLMGTTRYMSPEQIRGEPLDPRSDIFSLGIVLYEMLSGHPPFEARSQVETMNAILHDDPADLDGVPETIDTIVRRCLEKEPSSRFSSARDLSYALDAAARTSASTKAPIKRTTAPIRRSWVRLALMTAILAALIVIAIMTRGHRDTHEPPRLRPLTYSGRDNSPAASPDGKLIAFVSTRDDRSRIWLKQLADGTEVAITSGPEDSAPRFTHDGSSILFSRVEHGVSAIHRVAVVGGEPRKLIDNAYEGNDSPDGHRIAFIRQRVAKDRLSTLCVATIDGADVRELAASGVEEYASPRWSPDGRSIAVTRHPHGTLQDSVLIFDVESGERRVLAREAAHGLISGVAWTADGDAVVYAEREALSRAAAIIRHETSGDARVLFRNAHGSSDTIDIVAPGRIVLSEDVTRQNLQEVAMVGGAPRWLSRGMSTDRQPVYARDGRGVIFTSDRGGNVDLWDLDLGTGSLRRLTDHAAIDWDPHASGNQLFWSSNRGGHFEIWTASIDGANPRQLTHDGVDAENPTLPAAGDWVYYDSSNPRHDGLWRVPRAGGEAKLVVAGETIHPFVSADGAFVVYQRPEGGGTSAIDVVRVADGKVFTLAAQLGVVVSLRAHWIGTTHTIAFRTREGIVAQSFVPGVDTTSSRRQLVGVDAETFAISPDGTRAIVSVVDESSAL